MSTPNEYNQAVITEFRANGGKVGGNYANTSLLLLTTTGAKSGQPRTAPLGYDTDGDRLLIFASKMGSPTNPDWYHNLVANPLVTVELGSERFQARAAVAAGPECERLFAKAVAKTPFLGDHQRKTSCQIPIVILERLG